MGGGVWLALRDPEGVMLAALEVSELWRPSRITEAEQVFGTTNVEHPGVAALILSWFLPRARDGATDAPTDV